MSFRNVADLLPRDERLAFIEGEERITFAALNARIDAFARAAFPHLGARAPCPLPQAGEESREAAGEGRPLSPPAFRAIVMRPMSIDLYVALLGVFRAGGTAIFLDPWVGAKALLRLARFAGPRIWIGGWKVQLLRFLARAKPVNGDPSIALITYTTGSSGKPKGVTRTHDILRAQHERLAESFPPAPGDVDLCTFPVFALNNLAVGVPTFIPQIDFRRIAKIDAPKLAADARAAGVNHASASPPLFDQLARVPERPRFRRILTGGAPVSDQQLRAWSAAWPEAEIVVAYGSTEAEPVAHIHAEERLRFGGRGYVAGRIASGVRAKVIPIERGSVSVIHELPQGEIGELIVAGEHVCRTYEGDLEAVRQNKIADGETVWHRMGDTGWFDEEQRFRIAGRVHSTIDVDGRQLHPQLVEQAACGDDPRIRRAAALGVNGRAVIIVESADDVANDVRERVREYGIDDVRVTNEPLPVDPRHNSKIDYAVLKERL